MTADKHNRQTTVLSACCMGIVSVLLHYLFPTRIVLRKAPEFVLAFAAAALAVTAFLVLLFGFLLPKLRQKEGFAGRQKLYVPSLCWSVLALLTAAICTVQKCVSACLLGYVPVQTEGAAKAFSVLLLLSVPVLCLFAVLHVLNGKQSINPAE